MNYKKINFTDNRTEQIRLGKELSASYDDSMLEQIRCTFNRFRDFESHFLISKEDLLYISIYDYWAHGFIPEQELYFRLYEKTTSEKRQYISFKERFIFYSLLNKREYMNLLEDKYEAYSLLKPYYKRDVIKIASEDDFSLFLSFIEKHPVFISKPLGLSCAMGVQKIDVTQYQDKHTLFCNLICSGQKYSKSEAMVGAIHMGAVLEEWLEQDDAFKSLHPSSVNAIRMTTIRKNGEIHIYYPWIKVGVNGDAIASACTGGFDACINAKTGIVDTLGFLEDGLGLEYHPNTGVRILGFQIPRWQEAILLAKDLANKLPSYINYVGWDLVLTPNGWVVMEANYYGDMMWQMCYQTGMKSDLEELLGWKMEKPFWWQYNLKKLELESQ